MARGLSKLNPCVHTSLACHPEEKAQGEGGSPWWCKDQCRGEEGEGCIHLWVVLCLHEARRTTSGLVHSALSRKVWRRWLRICCESARCRPFSLGMPSKYEMIS